MSSFEDRVVSILNQNNEPYEREKTFSDLKNGHYRYDFYLPKKNALIEVDGEQHLKFTKVFYKNRTDFLKAQERDRKKNAYAIAKGIPLYRIPFYDIESLSTLNDLFKNEYLVVSIYHNDRLRKERKEK